MVQKANRLTLIRAEHPNLPLDDQTTEGGADGGSSEHLIRIRSVQVSFPYM